MKQLIMISGPMGVGKTTAARALLDLLPNSVMLDGDWCWEQGSHWNFSERNKQMVMDNICTLLGNFLDNPELETVIFSWVMHLTEISEEILARLEEHDFALCQISLVCSEETLRRRVAAKGGDEAEAERAVSRLKCFDALDTHKLDTEGKTPDQVLNGILCILNSDAPRCCF